MIGKNYKYLYNIYKKWSNYNEQDTHSEIYDYVWINIDMSAIKVDYNGDIYIKAMNIGQIYYDPLI